MCISWVTRVTGHSGDSGMSLLPEDRTILSLCDLSGEWPRPYREAGYNVVQVDLQAGADGGGHGDVRLLTLPEYPVWGILAAPPCTVFANAGARWPRSEADMLEGLSIVDACIRLAVACRPQWWALENPVGKLRRYLGDPTLSFQPCDYGDPYTKRTLLWGDFNPSLPRTPVDPTEGSKMHRLYGGKSERTKTARSVTPAGFARAFFEANP